MDTRSITSGGLAAPSDWSGETEGTYPRFGILKVDLGWNFKRVDESLS